MKEFLGAETAQHAGSRPLPLVDGWCRQALLGALGTLRGGQLVLQDGNDIQVLGTAGAPAARVWIHRRDFYRSLVLGGDLGAAESYMNGGWTADDLTSVLRIFARDDAASQQIEDKLAFWRPYAERLIHWLRRNSLRGSAANIHAHYDLGNGFFQQFLDPTMSYSAAIFDAPGMSLHDASIAKIDRACRKLDLQPDDHLLEIGTGWGAFALHAAKKYGCRVTTTTISAEQHALARQRVREAGMDSRIQVLREDYRGLHGSYDKLVSIEMIEAVGHQYLDTFFRRCGALLKPGGLMLLQAIVNPEYRYERARKSIDFIKRYIFPGSCLTSVGHMAAAAGRATSLRIVHLEDIAPHYAETLRQWRRNFLSRIPEIERLGYDRRFIRMWEYYLCYCEAGFEERIIGDVQILFEGPARRGASLLGSVERTGLACGASLS